jgi:Ni,Fe-hydrogenase III large subunit
MKKQEFISMSNGDAISMDDLPLLSMKEFLSLSMKEKREGLRIVNFFGCPESNGIRLIICFGNERVKKCHLFSTIAEKSYPALTPDFPQAHLFEREIHEDFGIIPEHHPWLKPVRRPTHQLHPSSFFQVKGAVVHEVAVGPVHAGIIEPGHFRFNCHGESVLHLEIALGYQHRGVEKALIGGPDARTIHYMETLAGDTTIGHATAYSQAVESLSETLTPLRADALRAVALELERLANHTGDLGALANDIGFLPTAAFCGRLRGDFLNMTAELCGSRFGRHFICPGGVEFDCDEALADLILSKLKSVFADTMQAVELLWRSPSILTRFENTGLLSRKMCEDLGIVGVAARASGVKRDVRSDFPFGMYQSVLIPSSLQSSGDVYARAHIRYQEIQKSALYIQKLLERLPGGPCKNPVSGELRPRSLVLSLTEGWRGEICHIAITDENGKWARYKIVDPSFHNWMGLAMAMNREEISNFPLCNKSFNLSYCGHDL